MKPQVELVVHCYSEVIPDFAALLTAQLSSLYLAPPQTCEVRLIVCMVPSDKLTMLVTKKFHERFNDNRLPVKVTSKMYRHGELFRRGYARNEIALGTKADIVWFADADNIYAPGCLDALTQIYRAGFPSKLVYPRYLYMQNSHSLGDQEIAKIIPGEIYKPDWNQFSPEKQRLASGGVQIVSGDTARKHGYCPKSKWSSPTNSETFLNTREDRAYRIAMGGSTAIDLTGAYRARHSSSAFQSVESRLSQTVGKA